MRVTGGTGYATVESEVGSVLLAPREDTTAINCSTKRGRVGATTG
jgi:hypothetical protein